MLPNLHLIYPYEAPVYFAHDNIKPKFPLTQQTAKSAIHWVELSIRKKNYYNTIGWHFHK